ncbi:hypothetical protein I302_101460 [Kwoniella bestiolae CBS 10118]|uniref:Uncharacterized protein n=1 Tax=Kwoniella bestiolae CBS 10118 TaxID=1296100 RepID=A0A1B9GCA2_9TREE|nr:hypothetical protein I302_00143 [Kwoniella bestiolae CBS 10118]OCF28654.1 hypothetical protein I302_00143 [Kwoniella bestiolae CBS 10118]
MSDPSGPIVRKAFLLEALLNLFSLPLITHTSTVLSYILKHPSQINPSSILFARLFGGIIIGGLTTALLYGARHIPSRRAVYWTLGMGEVLLIPLLALEGSKVNGALSRKVAWGSIGMLAPPLVWRVFVLYVRPDWIGRERVGKDERQPLIRDEPGR